MAPKTVALTSGEKAALKKIKAKENKAKANPELAAKNKESAGTLLADQSSSAHFTLASSFIRCGCQRSISRGQDSLLN